ncbi:hypothetical protein AYO21_06862 [Fonsecaea monophora]|uniref:Thioesterase domain-containing protein n=1 Tax=Fonsecaea monophora TaxID=254056 RepID=A0A177F3S0_9EURO|nr:hypothetical protein AYO21_06862 [Fonsecaea monophora]KAH0836008.1 hypothetical protein FOPE_04471 [Fonsecaea pedrosoi]OAG38984.1 hypothetical protein AYO21_06862 [Fonsecaea monophora]
MSEQDGKTDFMADFIGSHSISEDDRRYFASIEWTNKYLADPLYKAIPTFSRTLKDTGEDYFFARTINSPDTIPHLLSLQLKDYPNPPESPKGQLKLRTNHSEPTEVPQHPECVVLLSIGRPGLDGHPEVIHGGMACAILDEMMGLCAMLHQQHLPGPRGALFTVGLNITYRAPVPTPGDVLVRSWLVGKEGRKWLSRGQIVDKNGKVLTEAEGMWVLTKRQEKL